ncbi:MAG TPA: hypothetical protein VN039_05660 [Nitrospira sp.]|nr:hypothetical protein [Nitrospira sp.]
MSLVEAPPRVVWSPLPGSQTLALCCPAHILLYHGTRGPGKTDSQLMRFRRRVGQGYGRHWRGVIFDREYKNLDDLISKSMRWFPEFKDGARFLSSKSDYRWVWPSGEELLFRAIRRDSDYWAYHGQEFPFIGWNELTKYSSDTLFDMMMSCNRSSFLPEEYRAWDDDGEPIPPPPPIPLEVFATCNPFGAGHNWVKKRFIDAGKMGEIVRNCVTVFNPRTQRQEEVVKTQVHLFGSYRENKYLSPEYIAELVTMKDANKRKAWLMGSWDVLAGGMFDDVWDNDLHKMRMFKIPIGWRIDRSFDYGQSKPFSVGWWAESDGSDVLLEDGRTWMSTVKGDLFRIAEWYGCEEGKSNVGLRMLASDIAAGIVEREIAMGIHNRVQPGAADNAIWDVLNGNSIAMDMEKNVRVGGQVYRGVTWIRSDKSPGSRKRGWEQIRKRLVKSKGEQVTKADGTVVTVPRQEPGLFVFTNCKNSLNLMPFMSRDEDDPDDIDTNTEDHIADEWRYRVMSANMGARTGKTTGGT